MKSSGTFIGSERVFEKLRALCTERTVQGSTVLFGQGEAPKEVVLVLQRRNCTDSGRYRANALPDCKCWYGPRSTCHSGAQMLQPDRRFGRQVHGCHRTQGPLPCGASDRLGDDFGDCSNAGGRNFGDAELECAVPTCSHERTGHPMRWGQRMGAKALTPSAW